MTSTVLQIKVLPKRMLDKKEAAHHCGPFVEAF